MKESIRHMSIVMCVLTLCTACTPDDQPHNVRDESPAQRYVTGATTFKNTGDDVSLAVADGVHCDCLNNHAKAIWDKLSL